jgi:predicted nucleic acid-binding protein
MICFDTCVWIAYFSGESSRETDLLDFHLEHRSVVLHPVVLAELFSDAGMPEEIKAMLLVLPELKLLDGFWARAGRLRAQMRGAQMTPKLADTMIAQGCIDANTPLVTRDHGFQRFQRFTNLLLIT